MIAALYVQKDGAYWNLEGVDPWDEARDARRYAGPWPVVAHPPCARWCKLAGFVEHVYPGRFKKGDDKGCFKAALAAVRTWGGVLEHPEGSAAWAAHELIEPPRWGGWVVADWQGGWTCCVEQGAYGHRGRKATWLYAHGVDVPALRWGPASGDFRQVTGVSHNGRRASRTGVGQRLSKRQRAATPHEFRDLLLSIAKSARVKTCA